MTANNTEAADLTQRFFTVHEAAQILKVSQDTLRRMLRRGQLKCVVITERTRRIPLEALNDFAQKGMKSETTR